MREAIERSLRINQNGDLGSISAATTDAILYLSQKLISWHSLFSSRALEKLGPGVFRHSIPKYTSAVRTMHQAFYGTPVPHFPYVEGVKRAYTRCEHENVPAEEVRCGIITDNVKRI